MDIVNFTILSYWELNFEKVEKWFGFPSGKKSDLRRYEESFIHHTIFSCILCAVLLVTSGSDFFGQYWNDLLYIMDDAIFIIDSTDIWKSPVTCGNDLFHMNRDPADAEKSFVKLSS